MSRENVALVRGLMEKWNETHQPDFSVYHEDAQWDMGGWGFDVRGTFQGVEDWDRMLDQLWEVWEDVRVEPDEYIDAGDNVLFFARMYARRRDSGLEVSDAGFCVFTVRDGKVSRFALYRDRDAAFEYAGVKDADSQRLAT